MTRLARFFPHTLILGGLLMIALLGFATNSGAIGQLIGAFAAVAIDPVNLIAATILGLFIRRHLILLPSLIVLGVGLAMVIAHMNASLGARLTPEITVVKITAAIAVGYLANLVPMLLKREPVE